jgi:exopolyphosphatase/guanosine-5'-triphosphate,3'-diphosphate pyrophosphatase
MSEGPYAAIDCGSHSTRLLIMRGDATLVRQVELTKLGQGLDATGALQPEALERVYAALHRYRALLDDHQVDPGRVRVAATAAARDASNGAEFIAAAAQIVGSPAEVLSGTAEGELTFLGATRELDPADGPFLVIDIGGASTEFSYGHESFEAAVSLDIGSVRITDLYIESDPPKAEELSNCVTYAGTWLDDVNRKLPQVHQAKTVVGVAGTISTAVAVEIGIPEYDREQIHHFTLTREAAEDVFRTLATEDREARASNPGLPAGRVDTIVGGMAILVRTMRHLDLDSLLASESDILDGLARSAQHNDAQQNSRR